MCVYTCACVYTCVHTCVCVYPAGSHTGLALQVGHPWASLLGPPISYLVQSHQPGRADAHVRKLTGSPFVSRGADPVTLAGGCPFILSAESQPGLCQGPGVCAGPLGSHPSTQTGPGCLWPSLPWRPCHYRAFIVPAWTAGLMGWPQGQARHPSTEGTAQIRCMYFGVSPWCPPRLPAFPASTGPPAMSAPSRLLAVLSPSRRDPFQGRMQDWMFLGKDISA